MRAKSGAVLGQEIVKQAPGKPGRARLEELLRRRVGEADFVPRADDEQDVRQGIEDHRRVQCTLGKALDRTRTNHQASPKIGRFRKMILIRLPIFQCPNINQTPLLIIR